ncbi:MAG: hypothetical protein M1282_06970 [Chloroflexi bacterium]|nr:hypothetical protein [Chloroflexota bacterium]
MSALTIPLVGTIDGILLTLAAILAPELGIDTSSGWGKGRLALLSIGLIIIVTSAFLGYPRKNKAGVLSTILRSHLVKTVVIVGHIWAVVILIYIWFITFGNWTTWTHTTSYYDKLANSFSEGHLYIDIKPNPALLASTDPYTPGKRPTIQNDVWDMSFYNSRFYLYWGPVPALLLVPIKLLYSAKITDNYLVFLFYSALLIVNSLLIIKLWKKLYPNVPAWAVHLSIFLIGLIAPVLWSLSEPNIYNAAVGAAQFFFVTGIFWVISAFDKDQSISNACLFLAGLFWTGAVGSRAMYAVTIIPPAILTIIWIIKTSSKPVIPEKLLFNIVSFGLPLAVGAIILAWYNWARFGSPLEFGLRYQISIWDLNQLYSLLFLPRYIPSNLIVYLFQPFQFISTFPFIQPVMAFDLFKAIHFVPPQIYYAGRVTGLLFSAPFLIVAPAYFLQRKEEVARENNDTQGIFSLRAFVNSVLLSSFITGFFLLLLFFVGSMRYLMDVISPLALLAIIIFWRGLDNGFQSKPLLKKAFPAISIFLIAISILIGILLAFSNETDRFQVLNPDLFNKISQFFSMFK